MAVNPVTLAETLRPWLGAGVFCLLRDPAGAGMEADTPESLPVRKEALFSVLTSKASAHEEVPLFVPDRASGSALINGDFGGPASSSAVPSAPAAGVSRNSGSPEVPSFSGQPAALSSSVSVGSPPSPVSRPLPEEWQRILQRTPAAPLLWTYAELGLDLTAPGRDMASKERSEILRTLISKLALPRGSSSFWPLTLAADWSSRLEQGLPASDSDCFLQGLTQLAPKAVVFFGPPACRLSGVALHLRVPFTQQIFQGRLHVLAPAFAELAESEAMKDRTASYLHSAFAGFPSLFMK